MQNLKIKCPNCGRKDFITTDKFNPDIAPHGGMIRCLLPYQIDYLCAFSTLAPQITCPECLAPLVKDGALNVMIPARECGRFFSDESTTAEFIVFKSGLVVPEIGKQEVLSKSTERRLEAQYVCSVCGKEYKNAMGLHSHMRSHA